MNRQQLYTLSGVLLASTALSGVAYAATVGQSNQNGNTPGTTTLKISNTIFSTTATTADAVSIGGSTGGGAYVVSFTNSFTTTTKFSVEVAVAGAQFNTGAMGDMKVLVRDQGTNTGSFVGSAVGSATCASITPLVGKVIFDGCQLSATVFSATSGSGANASAAAGGLLLSGVTFNTANSLATVGNSISLSGTVYNTNNASQTFETITSGGIITSQAALTRTVTPCTNLVANPTATPSAFSYFNTNNDGGFLTICLASVTITGTGALSTTLLTATDLSSAGSSVHVTVSSTVLGSAAVTSVQVHNGSSIIVSNVTTANFAGGAATFSIGAAANNGIGTASAFSIKLTFAGSTPIPAAAAGTVNLVFGTGTSGAAQAAATLAGTTAAISRGGFNAQLNTFLASRNTSFTSYARIHNMGVVTGTATVTVRNDATGAVMGSSFETASIASGQTLQLSNADIESKAGITAASGVNYTIQLTGPIIGYAQHIIFNPATGQLADLSSFRNSSAGAGNSP